MAVPSERLKRLPQALVENGSVMKKAMMAVGYAEAYASQPSKLRSTAAYAEVMAPVVKQLEEARQDAIRRMKETVNRADYSSVSQSVERLTKQIQLLQGRATDIVRNDFSDLSDNELTAIIEKYQSSSLCQEKDTNKLLSTPQK